MSEIRDPEVSNKSYNISNEGSLAGARREAFSEERRNRSSSRTGKGRVEKKIEATLPKAEQPPNARSRKSSHILGLFKENAASQEPKKGHDKPRTEYIATNDSRTALQENDVMSPRGREAPTLRSFRKDPDGKISPY